MEYLTSFISYNLLPILLNMSLTGALVILFVLAIRHYLLKKTPKIFSYALWAVVLFRLLCPVSFSADFSLLGFLDPPALRTDGGGASMVEYIPYDIVHTEYPRVELPLMPVLSDTINETLPYGDEQLVADPLEFPMAALTLWVWPIGLFTLLIYSAVSYIRLRRKLIGAALLRDNIWLADHIGSPFVMGLFRPKIYLPSSLSEWERDYIILHEQHHIRRGDHVIKALSFLALCIHWFNPLVWVAFVLSGQDMEMSCDEAVIRKLGPDIRADYSRSLLSLATGRPILSGTPLAFGEGDTKGRIKNLASWKKAKPIVLALCLVLVIAVAIFCGANAGSESWAKTTLTGGPSFEFTLNLEKPVYRWTIYEDVYIDGKLSSSASRVSHSIPDYAGSAQRRFTSTLRPTYGMGKLTCTFSGQEEVSWTLSLPFYKHGSTGFDQYDGTTHSTQRQPLEVGSSFVLATFTLDEGDLNNDIGVVILYRLVTSTDPNPPQEDSSSGAPEVGTDSPAPVNSSQPVPEDAVSALLDVICSSPAHSSNPGDYISAHPEEYQRLVDGGADTLRHFFSRFLEGDEYGLEGHIMWAACEDIMRGLGEAFILDTVTMTGQERFNAFRDNAHELARQYNRTDMEKLHPCSTFLLMMTGGFDIPAPTSEFALTINHMPLELGGQKGLFPWDTDLKAIEHTFWSGDGFDCFSFTCEDGTVLTGLRNEGVPNEYDGWLMTIETTNPDWLTPRGAYVGMVLDEFLTLYPDAVRRVHVSPGDHSYTYQEETAGFNQIFFTFEENILTSISIGNGMDGYLW